MNVSKLKCRYEDETDCLEKVLMGFLGGNI